MYLDKEELIITVSFDSIIRLYKSPPDGSEAKLLRELRGGHLNSEISTVYYNHETLALLTGAYNGTIGYWNFENSKLDYLYVDKESEVTSLYIPFPFKCILSTSADGFLYGWKIKFLKKHYSCLFKINMREGYLLDRTYTITDINVRDFFEEENYQDSVCCQYFSQEDYLQVFDEYLAAEKNEERKLSADKNMQKIKKNRIASASSRGSRKPPKQLDCPDFYELEKIRKFGYEYLGGEEYENFKQNHFEKHPDHQESRNNSIFRRKDGFLSPNTLNSKNFPGMNKRTTPSSPNKSTFFGTQQRSVREEPTDKTFQSSLLENEKEPSGLLNSSNSMIYEDETEPVKKMLIMSDSKGFLKTMVLDPLMAYYNVGKFKTKDYNLERYKNYRMNLGRKDNVIAEKSAENFYYLCKKMLTRYFPPLMMGNVLLRRRWRAHKGGITSMNHIPGVKGLLTCGHDKYIKIWGLCGQQYARISLMDFDRKIWNFPFDWIKVITDELDAVFNVYTKLEGVFLDQEKRENLTASYFYRNFIFKDLKRRYEISDHFLTKKVNKGDINRMKYLQRVKE